MPTIGKIGVLVSILWLCLSPLSPILHAGETTGTRYGFSVSPRIGMLYGHAEEIVYKTSGKDHYMSELLWDLKPLFYIGLDAEFGPRNRYAHSGFIAAGSLKSQLGIHGIPPKTGINENRDWKYPDNQNLTNYSRHDAYSQRAILADISIGYSWRLTNSLAVKAYGIFSYMHFSWIAKDGYYQYLESDEFGNIFPLDQIWDKNMPKTAMSGPANEYFQNWFIVSPGISLTWKFSRQFSLEGNFSYSPLIYCFARDDHILRNTVFYDYLSFGHFINGGGSLIYSPTGNLDISLSFSYRHISGSRGDTRIKEGSHTWDIYDTAGAAFSAVDISLTAKIRVIGRNQ